MYTFSEPTDTAQTPGGRRYRTNPTTCADTGTHTVAMACRDTAYSLEITQLQAARAGVSEPCLQATLVFAAQALHTQHLSSQLEAHREKADLPFKGLHTQNINVQMHHAAQVLTVQIRKLPHTEVNTVAIFFFLSYF